MTCICVLGVSIVSLFMIFLLDLGTALTMWYFLFFILFMSWSMHISQLIRFSRACGSYQDFLDSGLLLQRQLLNQGFLLVKLKLSLRKSYRFLWCESKIFFRGCVISSVPCISYYMYAIHSEKCSMNSAFRGLIPSTMSKKIYIPQIIRNT